MEKPQGRIPFEAGTNRNFSLRGDKGMLVTIVEDMLANGGRLAPADHWLSVSHIDATKGAFDETAFETNFAKLDQLLDPWLGCTGMRPVDEDAWLTYRDFLTRIDFLRMLPSTDPRELAAQGWLSADLGTVMDLNLINAYAEYASDRPALILEVGGGYGRLAHAFHNIIKNNVKFVLVDAVPASLLYAYIYMSQFRDIRVGSYYNGDELDLEKFDCYVAPAWHFERMNTYRYDISINVESLQETSQEHVDYYLELFDRLTVDRGIIYISNAHDYVFKGEWRYPAHWKRLYMHNTPRSWSPNHPTEVFRKGDRDFTVQNNLHILEFERELADRARIAELEASLLTKDGEYWSAQREILELWSRLRDLVEKR